MAERGISAAAIRQTRWLEAENLFLRHQLSIASE
jgi:hypothetical protein